MLVHIFLTMKGALPTTLHELFCNLVLCCIVRELDTHESKSDTSEVCSLDDLPDDLRSKLSDLCVLAYEGVMQNKVVFYQDDLQKFNLPANLPSLGLLQAVEGLTLHNKSLSYNFLHLSVQELLAAYHISHMGSSKQMKVFKQIFGSSRFQAVLHYYSGFTKLTNNQAIRKFISTYSQQKSQISYLLPLLHCFYEAQDLSLCSLVTCRSGFTGNVVEVNFQLNTVDHLAVGYFITFLLSEPSYDATNIYLKINCKDFICQNFKLLLLEPTKKFLGRDGWSRRLEMELNGMPITEELAELIVSHLKKLSLWPKLIIRNCKISKNGLLHITEALQKKDYSHLTELQIVSDQGFNYQISYFALAFKKLLRTNKSLTHLRLSGHYILDLSYIFKAFSTMPH